MLQIYNTLTRSKESFQPRKSNEVKVYSCGPTPYNFSHIGNFATYLAEDIIIRTLRFLGYSVKTAMNFTDIDDKTIRSSLEQKIPLFELTQKYIDAFHEDISHLRIIPADSVVRISSHIHEMQLIIQKLLDTSYAYLGDDGSIYYSVDRFSTYGDLAQISREGMMQGVRISHDEYEKEELADFALWKGYDPVRDGENVWTLTLTLDGKEVSFPGRPGWHIECSACNLALFGDQIDLHMGAIDNLFPHHQNEVAQTEAFTGKQFSKYWIHMGHLLVDNKKMAKSKNNFYTLRDVFDHFPDISKENISRAFRLMRLQTRHRENFNFQFERIQSSITTLQSFDETLKRLDRMNSKDGSVRLSIRNDLQSLICDYISALEDDFNTPEALVYWFELQKMTNTLIDENLLTHGEKRALFDAFSTMDQVLDLSKTVVSEVIPDSILFLAQDRLNAKKEKRFADADSLRGKIEDAGYLVIDTLNGFHLEKKD